MFTSFDLRAYQAEQRRAREADAPERVLRLQPQFVELWTAILQDAANTVERSAKPCDYAPWEVALARAGAHHGLVEDGVVARFSRFLWDVSQPAWPEPRRDLIGFALAALDCDVMLFRSGYAKRHLIKRLQQASLTEADVARIEAMLRRAVIDGTGLEEYRAWCKLAGHLAASGRVDGLQAWLSAEAEGAILTLDRISGPIWFRIFEDLPQKDLKRLSVGGILRPHVNGLRWPDLGMVVPAGKLVNARDQQIKRNAWRMLDHISRRTPHGPQESSIKSSHNA